MTDTTIKLPAEMQEWIADNEDEGYLEPQLIADVLAVLLPQACIKLHDWNRETMTPSDMETDDMAEPCWIVWFPGIKLDDVTSALRSVLTDTLVASWSFVLYEHSVIIY